MSRIPAGTTHKKTTTGVSDIEAPFRIELCSGGTLRRSIDEGLALSVRITNISDGLIWMVGVVPGSEGLRYPHYIAEIEGPQGSEKMRSPEDLDYVRGLRTEDFVQIAPGQNFDPQGRGFIPIQSLAWFRPTQPGKYQLRLRFDATERDPQHWLGHTRVADQNSIEKLICLVPPVRVWSNTLEVEYG